MFNPIPAYNPDRLSLDILWDCNASCAHCGNDSRKGFLDDYTISRIMQEAGEQELILFDVSGGEVFLDLDKLKHTIKEGVINGLVPDYIATNAYFANSVDDAKDALKELKDVGFGKQYFVETKKIKKAMFFRHPNKERYQEAESGGLGISLDEFHKKFVDPANVANLIVAYNEVFGTTDRIGIKSGHSPGYDFRAADLINLLAALESSGLGSFELYGDGEDIFNSILKERKIRLKSGDMDFLYFPVDPIGQAKCLDFDLKELPDKNFEKTRYCCGLFHQGPSELYIAPDGSSYAYSEFLCRSGGMYLGNVHKESLESIIKKGKKSLAVDMISFDGANMLRKFMKNANMAVDIESTSTCHFCYQVLSDENKVRQLEEYYGGIRRLKMLKYDLAKLELRLHGMGILP